MYLPRLFVVVSSVIASTFTPSATESWAYETGHSTMLTGPAQYLEVHLPSPTTVSFTVTTRRQDPSKLRSRLITLFRHVCRVVLVFYTLLTNLIKGQQIFGFGALSSYVDFWLNWTLGSGLIKLFADRLEWWIIVPVSLMVMYLCLRRDYVGT